ncbi:DUF1775 domain-containing protein [Paracoccus sp. (in: a-proteobacteria)]|uniref:DUF1775 domain-containing protein n=1 Tax=Paracoccus sp. TaxID=267 RepID=UPI0035AEE29B
MQKHIIGALGAAILGAASLGLGAGAAQAHATLESKEAPAGAAYRAVIRIGHGCKGEATQTLRVKLPEGFYNAKPMPKAGWTLETVKGAYATPFDNHGTPMTEGTREVVWSGGDLSDDWYDEFVLRGTVGPEVAPGTVLYFQTVQECANGTADWTDTSGNADLPNPAPGVTVTAAAAKPGHHMQAMAPEAPAPVVLGDLTLSNPYSRASLPKSPVAGGFLTITNAGGDDRLIGVSADAISARGEIHDMKMEGDVMKMRELPDGLPIPAGETVELMPGAKHLMFMELKQPLVAGEQIKVKLVFEKAGEVELPMNVVARDAAGAMQGGMNGAEHGDKKHAGH